MSIREAAIADYGFLANLRCSKLMLPHTGKCAVVQYWTGEVPNAKGPARLRACSSNSESADGAAWATSKEKPWSPARFQKQLLHFFNDFGMGGGNLVEGSIGLLVVTGSLLMGARAIWAKGSQLRSQPRKYEAVIEFPLALGITIGTPIRVRGVDVGTVIRVRPSLEKIDASIQVMDSSVVIPRNALVEVNQSGLLSETVIDITPEHPVPHPSFGPLDPNCSAEGLIVCNKERIRGKQGVSLDELVGLCGKMARKMDTTDVSEISKTAGQIEVTLDNIKPLLDKIEAFMEDIEPAMKELQDSRLLKDLTESIKLATNAAYSLRSSSMARENSRVLHDSVVTLTSMLKGFESTVADVGVFIGNDKTRNNLKLLIESLSRLVKD